MLFFMFVAGLEVNPTYLHKRGRSVVGTSLLGIVLPCGLGVGTVVLMPEVWGAPAQEHLRLFALFMGVALSISALPVIARILLDLSLIRDEIGVTVLAAATIDDLIGWSLFAMLLGSFGKYSTTAHLGTMLGLVVGCMTLMVGLGWWRGRALLQWTRVALAWPSGFIGLITIIVLIAAALAEAIGIHAIFGAFFVGVALGRAFGEDDQHAHEILYQFAISFFAPLYFVSIGLKADFAAHFDLLLVLIVFVIACIGKIVGASLGAWLGGMPRQEALAVGFGMNARGAMEMILASVALEYQVIDQRIFVALITMALTTSMLSGPMMQRLLQKTSCRQP
jgi:Kef-type K+ transport system membrane component KefB